MEAERLSKVTAIALALVLAIVPAAAGAAGAGPGVASAAAEDPDLRCNGEINDEIVCRERCRGGGYTYFILGGQTPCTN